MKKKKGFTETILTLDPKAHANECLAPSHLDVNKIPAQRFDAIDRLFDAEREKANKV